MVVENRVLASCHVYTTVTAYLLLSTNEGLIPEMVPVVNTRFGRCFYYGGTMFDSLHHFSVQANQCILDFPGHSGTVSRRWQGHTILRHCQHVRRLIGCHPSNSVDSAAGFAFPAASGRDYPRELGLCSMCRWSYSRVFHLAQLDRNIRRNLELLWTLHLGSR